MLRRALLGLVVAAALAAPAIAAAPPFAGTWIGNLKAQDGGTTRAVVTIARDARSGKVVWAASRCTAKLVFLKRSGRVLWLRARPIAGQCDPQATLKLAQIDFRTLFAEYLPAGAQAPLLSGYVTLGGR